MDRPGLADFLRRRREALQPTDVGLPPGSRRRTEGLRREEVAQLVGMSADYYTRLEQQRGPQPSDQMLAAIARGMRLTLDERDHLFQLAGHTAPQRMLRSAYVSPPLLRVLDRLTDTPALVLSDIGETLAQNPLAAVLLGDAEGRTGLDRSVIHRWFTEPGERDHYPERDHGHQGRLQVAQLRAAATVNGGSARADELVRDLLGRSAEFAGLWERHEFTRRFEDTKTLTHPEAGEIELDCQALFTEDQSQTLLVLTARAGTDAADKLALLSVLGSQHFAG